MVQQQDYFTLSSIGLTASGTIVSAPKQVPLNPTSATTVYYTTQFKGSQVFVPYSFLYWNGVAFPNPVVTTLPSAVAYYGAVAINDIALVLDNLTITNTSSSALTTDIISVSPANALVEGVPIIPPSLIKRVSVPADDSVSLSQLDLRIPMHSNIPAPMPTASGTQIMTGNGVGVAFPSAKQGTSATTTASINTITVTGIAHFDKI